MNKRKRPLLDCRSPRLPERTGRAVDLNNLREAREEYLTRWQDQKIALVGGLDLRIGRVRHHGQSAPIELKKVDGCVEYTWTGLDENIAIGQ